MSNDLELDLFGGVNGLKVHADDLAEAADALDRAAIWARQGAPFYDDAADMECLAARLRARAQGIRAKNGLA